MSSSACGMLVLAGAGVENRHGARRIGKLPAHAFGKPAFGRSHDDHVEIRGERADRILTAFPFEFRRRGRVADRSGRDAENLAGGEMGKERARRRLREVQHRAFVREHALEIQSAFPGLVYEADAVRQRAEPVEKRPVELLGEQSVVRHRVRAGALKIRLFLFERKRLELFPSDFRQIGHCQNPFLGRILPQPAVLPQHPFPPGFFTAGEPVPSPEVSSAARF